MLFPFLAHVALFRRGLAPRIRSDARTRMRAIGHARVRRSEHRPAQDLPRAVPGVILVAAMVSLAFPAAAQRPDTPGTSAIFRYDAGDAVESIVSPGGEFRVHFTRTGSNAVPSTDADGSGVPDHVESVAVIYDEVLAFYAGTLGYRPPLDDGPIADDGGDGLFDVYLLDFGGSADGSFRPDGCGLGGARPTQCAGYLVQENDFLAYGYPSISYANRLLASHELFHAIQAAYDTSEGSVIGEGTAVWASEAFDPSLRDLEAFSRGYLEETDRPIDRPLPGPVDRFSYGSGLFFRFLEERFDRDLLRELWEACEDGEWLPALDALLGGARASSFEEAFREFAEWNLFTGVRADPSRAYANGASYAEVRFEPAPLPFVRDPLRVFYASAHYFTSDPGSRASVGAELAGEPADVAGIDLLLAVRRGEAIEVVRGPMVDTAGADELITVLVRPSRDGDSQRPALCVGSRAELDDCRALMTAMPDGGMLARDGGRTEIDAGAMVPPSPRGCACRATRPRAGGEWALAIAALVVALDHRRRARHHR